MQSVQDGIDVEGFECACFGEGTGLVADLVALAKCIEDAKLDRQIMDGML